MAIDLDPPLTSKLFDAKDNAYVSPADLGMSEAEYAATVAASHADRDGLIEATGSTGKRILVYTY